ncbi:MAG: prepilin-type N-terminal cleavage/methylation domain-containing protein [Acidobacteria bacterium]|nr:prepilin-type N-terminal cleavage/methylation domain-containing protein [Acidobacteriota bacterium]
MKHKGRARDRGEAGFSMIELLIAMGLTLVVMTLASTLLVSLFNVKTRQNRRSEALADSQRTIDLMTREVANAGFGLLNNGIVPQDSDANSIRIRANLNANSVASDANEDVKYALVAGDGDGTYLVRSDINGDTSVVAPVDALNIRYFRERVTYTAAPNNCNVTNAAPANVGAPAVANEVAGNEGVARYVVISMCIQLPEVGTPDGSGYQPPTVLQLVSDASLRNGNLLKY